MQIDYSAIRLRSQERIRFRYKLNGFDHDWTEPLNSRVANYTNLPPGTYRFDVQAFEMNTPEGVTEASLQIQWRPHLYRTPWFVGLCALSVVAAAFGAYRFRLRQVHARFEAVLEERNRIAREMHDTVIQGCVSASALLEAVVSLEPEDSGPGRHLLDTARNQVRDTVDEARRAVWNLRQGETGSPAISNLLEQMAQQVSEASRVRVQFEASGNPQTLDRTVEYVILMVAREAVANAVHHGQPAEVRVNVHFNSDNIQLNVLDDGRGFDIQQVLAVQGAHFGLIGMRERIEHLGGHFQIDSSPGKGTRLSVEIPLRPVDSKKDMESLKV